MSLDIIGTSINSENVYNVIHSIGQNPGKHVEHEWVFIRMYLTTPKFITLPLAKEFISFQESFFPEYQWKWNKAYYDMAGSIIREAGFCDYIFEKKNIYDDWNEKEYDQAKKFGDIMTEYMIRTKGYSLITTDIRKSIVTSEQNCAKKFEEYIEEGYHIHRLAKMSYTPSKYDLFGWWTILPVFPTDDDNLSCEVQEFIEDKNKQLIKVSKY